MIKDLEYKTSPSQEMYLVYELENECEIEIKDLKIDISLIPGLRIDKRPSTITVEQLMKAKSHLT